MQTNVEVVRAALLGSAASLEVVADRVENLGMADRTVIDEMLAISRRIEDLSRAEFVNT